MDRENFENLSYKHFVPEVLAFLKEKRISQKALLLLDNAHSHPKDRVLTSDESLSLKIFFPQCHNCYTPMDQELIAPTKKCYRVDLRTLANDNCIIERMKV
jgi:hypothetical protein